MKRFWQQVATARTDAGWQVLLDGRAMRLPGEEAVLLLPCAALAEAVAAEWRGAPGDAVRPEALPLTGLAATAQARIAPDPDPVIAAIARYGETDLLCYRAPAGDLADRQAQAWQPWLDWAASTHGARLHITNGIVHRAQEPAALQALHAAVAARSIPELAALGVMVPLLGSLVLGLAILAGTLPPEAAHMIASLEDIHQSALWGDDAEATARRTRIGQDIADAARFVLLARQKGE